jgi:hypothetical protein
LTAPYTWLGSIGEAFTIEDFHDLIDLLEQHPEWRAELRRHVLSDDLLELPALVRQLVEAQARTDADVSDVKATLAELARTQARTETILSELAASQGRTETRLGHVDARLGDAEGDLLELRYARRGPAYLSTIARRLRVIEPGTLADLLDDAIDDGRLTWDERETILLTDIVLSGRRRRDGQDIYLAVEVSGGIREHNVDRAIERARLLEKLGQPAIPIVAGRRIDDKVAQIAYEHGVWSVLGGRAVPPRSF